jgi:hypothetical protein
MRTEFVELSGPVFVARDDERHPKSRRALKVRTRLGSAESWAPALARLTNHLGEVLMNVTPVTSQHLRDAISNASRGFI